MGAFENACHEEETKESLIDMLGRAFDENRQLIARIADLEKRSNQIAYDKSESYFTIALDFDGTLVDRGQWPDVGSDLGSGYWLKKLEAKGAKFILWTMRDGLELQAAIEYCRVLGIELFGVNDNPTQMGWTRSPKAHCTIFVDDRNLGSPLCSGVTDHLVVDWMAAGPMLLEAQENWKAERDER